MKKGINIDEITAQGLLDNPKLFSESPDLFIEFVDSQKIGIPRKHLFTSIAFAKSPELLENEEVVQRILEQPEVLFERFEPKIFTKYSDRITPQLLDKVLAHEKTASRDKGVIIKTALEENAELATPQLLDKVLANKDLLSADQDRIIIPALNKKPELASPELLDKALAHTTYKSMGYATTNITQAILKHKPELISEGLVDKVLTQEELYPFSKTEIIKTALKQKPELMTESFKEKIDKSNLEPEYKETLMELAAKPKISREAQAELDIIRHEMRAGPSSAAGKNKLHESGPGSAAGKNKLHESGPGSSNQQRPRSPSSPGQRPQSPSI